jgi:hypothetical protein
LATRKPSLQKKKEQNPAGAEAAGLYAQAQQEEEVPNQDEA